MLLSAPQLIILTLLSFAKEQRHLLLLNIPTTITLLTWFPFLKFMHCAFSDHRSLAILHLTALAGIFNLYFNLHSKENEICHKCGFKQHIPN